MVLGGRLLPCQLSLWRSSPADAYSATLALDSEAEHVLLDVNGQVYSLLQPKPQRIPSANPARAGWLARQSELRGACDFERSCWSRRR